MTLPSTQLAERTKAINERQKQLSQLIKLRNMGKGVNAYDLLPASDWIEPTEMYVDSVTVGPSGLIRCLPTFTFKIWLWHFQEGLQLADLCLIFQAMQRPAIVARMRFENDHYAELAGLVHRAIMHRRDEAEKLERQRQEEAAAAQWADNRPLVEEQLKSLLSSWSTKKKPN